MTKFTWKDWLVIIVVALVLGAGTFVALLQIQQWRVDSANLQAVIQLINFNVQQGHLTVPPAVAPPAPAAAPAPPPAPEPPKK